MKKTEIKKVKSNLLSKSEARDMIKGLFLSDQIEIEEIRIGIKTDSVYLEGIKEGYELKFDPKIIKEEINQLKSKYLITKISFPYNYGDNFQVEYGRYYGAIKFKKITQEEGAVELTINANKEMLSSIIALCFDNSISVCENQISNLQKLYLDKVASGVEGVKSCSDNIVAKVEERKGILARLGLTNKGE